MALWTPTELGTALKAWWKADALPVVADATALASWADSSGNSRTLTQATGANQPLYKTAIQNSLPVVRFDGTNDFLTIANTLGLSAQPLSFAMAWKTPSAATLAGFAMGTTDTGTLQTVAGPNLIFYNGSVVNVSAAFDTWMVNVGVANGASSSLSVNGTNTTGNFGATAPSGNVLNVGADRSGAARFHNRDIGELLFLNTSLATSDRQKLEGYLAWKWGLQASLVAGHPYLGGAPTLAGHTGLRFSISRGLRQRTIR